MLVKIKRNHLLRPFNCCEINWFSKLWFFFLNKIQPKSFIVSMWMPVTSRLCRSSMAAQVKPVLNLSWFSQMRFNSNIGRNQRWCSDWFAEWQKWHSARKRNFRIFCSSQRWGVNEYFNMKFMTHVCNQTTTWLKLSVNQRIQNKPWTHSSGCYCIGNVKCDKF